MSQTPRLKPLISRAAIRRKVRELGRRISQDFRGQPVHLVGVLKGAGIFLADLAREITLETTIDFVAVASYGRGTSHSGRVKLVKDLDSSIADRNVILVDDILDTGKTADYLLRRLARRQPKTLRLAALLDKPARRRVPGIRGDYVGFVIPNEFMVGYGLDFAGRYRHLKDVCVLGARRRRQGHSRQRSQRTPVR